MNHLAAEWEKSRGVGGRENGMPDLVDDSVNGVITTIPLSQTRGYAHFGGFFFFFFLCI